LGDETPLLLADQATFCLSGAHRYCQRYTLLQAEDEASGDPLADEAAGWPHLAAAPSASSYSAPENTWPIPQELPTSPVTSGAGPWLGPRWWTWVGAGLFFLTVLLGGSLYAAYTGWQLALANLAEARAGQVNTLANRDLQPQPYVIFVTATAASVAAQPAAEQPSAPQVMATTPPDANAFPAAVTATPVIVVPLPGQNATANNANAAPVQLQPRTGLAAENSTPAPPANIQLPGVAATATPVIDVFMPIPSPRATPIFDIPTGTAVPLEPTATPTVTPLPPILGTPVIVFAPDNSQVAPGKCTQVRWHVENVREVYYENLPSFGDGTHQECIDDEAETYALTVVFATGQTKIYTTTVDVLWPTDTPEPTATFTPEIEPTVTWTPLPPTATPTPNVVYGVTLATDGDGNHACTAGAACEIGLFATNAGDTADNVSIELLESGSWAPLICRQDGVCAQSKLTLSTVGPGNTAFVKLRLEIPAEAIDQSSSYALRAVSEGSGGSMVSQVVTINVTVTGGS